MASSFVKAYKPNRKGIIGIMKSAGVQGIVGEKAAQVAARASGMANDMGSFYAYARYGSRVTIGGISAHGIAYTANRHAMLSESYYALLQWALGGGW